jgi:hypothetical protein
LSSNTPSTSRDKAGPDPLERSVYLKWVYRLTLWVLAGLGAYSAGWAIVDVGVRTGFLPPVILGWAAADLFHSLSIWQEAAFFSSTGLFLASVWLCRRRHVWTFAVFLGAATLYQVDAVLILLNQFFNHLPIANAFGPILALQAFVFLALMQLYGQNVFGRDREPDARR